jgi:hypothetical protein
VLGDVEETIFVAEEVEDDQEPREAERDAVCARYAGHEGMKNAGTALIKAQETR